MTQNNPDQRDTKLASAIRLLAHAVVFFAGAVMFGLGGMSDSKSAWGTMLVGGGVLFVSGIMFIMALWD